MISAGYVIMLYFLLANAFSLLLDLIWLNRRTDKDKDLEILLLRQQLRILQRKQSAPPRVSRWEKLTLVVLARKLTPLTASARARLGQVFSSSSPTHCSNGIGNSCADNGPSRKDHQLADRQRVLNSRHCSSGWRKKIRPGAMVSWRENSASSGTTSDAQPSALCSSVSMSRGHQNAASTGAPGARFSHTTKVRSWPVTSSWLKPRGSRRCMSCFSLSSAVGVSTWPAGPQARRARG